ncbi:E3 ubiquitin-protein ligase MIB1 [Geodia barretti]|uniref:E3 ubiquitin-protein ligase MIB1 n=1 Tax=Geodia barretti TaxID=519541 RepID=A0AA35RJQ4_GEOBA|nr:E3 ubiquitin-protein ligase MIB1 [Geodia barretti]
MVACDSCSSIMTKCVKCRTAIETAVPLSVASGGRPLKVRGRGSRGSGGPVGSQDIASLQQQLQEMKEKTQCQVCMDRRKNCVFLCGHGTCQLCADKIIECPICRKLVSRKIILFD